MKVKHSRIVVLFWLRCRTVSCSESSLCCSAEALLMTSADSVWISANMLLACRDRSDSWRRMLIKVWQFTASRSREANTSPLTSSRSLFILPRLRGSTILLWNGIFFKENFYLFVILQLVHLFFISVSVVVHSGVLTCSANILTSRLVIQRILPLFFWKSAFFNFLLGISYQDRLKPRNLE